MRRYDSYKDSGQQWLGEIPSHWEIKRLASYFKERRNKVSDKEYAPLSVTKLGIFPQWENVAKTNDGDNRKLVKTGDFVINSRSDRKGSSGISDRDGSVSLINTVLQLSSNIYPPFCHYLLRSYSFIEEYYRNGHGIVADLWTTGYDEMKMIKLAIPKMEEQKVISFYLDKISAEIDKAIAQQQRMIDLLNERRQIIIQQAVTKGLNPNVKMKNSGVEWIGQVPEHWKLYRFKYFLSLQNVISTDVNNKIGLENIEGKTGRFIKTNSKFEGNGVAFEHGDLVYGKLRPYLQKVWLATFQGSAVGDFFVFRTKVNSYNKYVFYVMLSDGFTSICNGATFGAKMPRVSSEFIHCIQYYLPPLSEQQEIASYLDKQCEKIDKAIAQQQRMIDILKERKQIIINEAVTGKTRVV